MLYKNLSGLILMAAMAVIFSGCGKDKVDLPDQPVESYSRVYIPAAANNPVFKTFKITDSTQTVTYGAMFGGYGYPDQDIPVTFVIDNVKIDSFNQANNTNYGVLPDGTYTFSTTSSVIPKGQVSTPPLSITFKTKGTGAIPILKDYLLPVSISNTSIKVNEGMRTVFYVIRVQPDLNDYPNYDRSSWQVINFSSQEANGEGPNNGRVVHTFDGNNSSFWHTQWQGGSPGPPHHFTIDMGSVQTLHGLSFLGRQSGNSGKPNEVKVQVSLDNSTWIDAGTFNLQNINALQPKFLPEGFQDARYFRITINTAYGASFTHLAEIYAF